MPEWMKDKENYIPPSSGSTGFADRSTLTILRVLSGFRLGSAGSKLLIRLPKCSSPVKFLLCLVLIILVSAARNMLFCYILLAVVIAVLCILPSERLASVLAPAAAAAVFSAVILIPAIFMGSPRSMLTISTKVFLSVSMVGIMAATTGWNEITAALRAYRVPNIFIFTLDMTLKYIAICAGLCLDLLDALRLRSVGRPARGGDALGGILGTTFLRSRRMSEETAMAMECRGFDGDYPSPGRGALRKTDIIYLMLTAAAAALFCILHMH